MSIRNMDLLLGTIFCLLFSYIPCQEVANSGMEFEDVEGHTLPPLKLALSICGLKAVRGPCKAIHTHYYFNIQTHQCEIFDYGGCEGNENNFSTLQECQEKCIVADLPEKKRRAGFQTEKPPYCLLESDPGICRGLISRYFYNKESQQCEKFKYGGCLGNQNNFESLQKCQDTCQDIFPSDNSLHVVDYGRIPLNVTTDSTLAAKQAPSDNSLHVVDYGRKPFNVTTHSTPAAKQESILLPSLCMMPVDRGLCRASAKRFFYNYTIGKCYPFHYSGCGGNENNFTSRKSCLQMCKKGFIKKRGQGIMKIHRGKKKQPVRLRNGEIIIETI
ncbi:tissue factor pathway inhibitor [Hemicordylus capensis]|uniref:tissue factor pathway inhibitor n=1 Tax=Hemicordylus capensis TaxID=884348 RepID=UPI002304A50E|nr:tissue factor pathway inhibitor [Hemicordylus capensis]